MKKSRVYRSTAEKLAFQEGLLEYRWPLVKFHTTRIPINLTETSSTLFGFHFRQVPSCFGLQSDQVSPEIIFRDGRIF